MRVVRSARWLALGLGTMGGCNGCNGGSGEELLLADGNNYTFSNDITMQVTEIQAGEDARIDWSGLLTDVRGREVTEIQQISMLKFSYPFDELVPLFATNEIDAQAEATESYLFDVTTSAEAMASDFEITGVGFIPADLFVDDPTSTWTVSAVNYPGGRLDLLMSKAFQPTADSTNHEITLGDGDTLIDYVVDLHSAPPLAAPAGVADLVLDWTDATTDVYGHPFDPVAGDELLIGHYAGDVTSVEEGFLQLDTNADQIYRLSVIGATSAVLADAADESGGAFAGFTTDGTWLVAISCSSCSTPVPLLLAVVEVN
ncbi:MAG: hypothetical protein ABMA64_08930 [Myxococcota bacterium]